MTATHCFSHTGQPPSRLTSALRRFVARTRRFAEAYRNRNRAAVLAEFDDRMLADIGLTRSDVRDAFSEPLWQDPTDTLRFRALERRLSRHGLSTGFADTDVAAPPLAPADGFNRPPTDRPARYAV